MKRGYSITRRVTKVLQKTIFSDTLRGARSGIGSVINSHKNTSGVSQVHLTHPGWRCPTVTFLRADTIPQEEADGQGRKYRSRI